MGLDEVLRSAARLQELVPDAVLVGGTAAALYAGHRDSTDHDHVVADLSDRFDAVLEALESDPDWILNRATPGKIILGSLGDIETGIRQLIRRRPLETQAVTLADGTSLIVPTPAETLRIKAYLIVKRNQTRDFLDVAALSDRFGTEWSAGVLAGIDDYYDASAGDGTAVASQLVRQLGEPRPKDDRTVGQLTAYKNLTVRWQSWQSVVAQCQALADAMLETP
ncbi:MAG: hypothetical protein NT156_05025 [Mycobacterium sp.]|nr:hypothetical protein [Mycobacterium sp.]